MIMMDIDNEKKWWIFTFGCGQKYAGHYVKFFGTYGQARNQMIKRFGFEWSMQYSIEKFQKYVKENIARETELSVDEYSRYDLTEYNKLKELLIKYDIPFEERIRNDLFEDQMNQLIYPNIENRKSDVIIGVGTYGRERGLLEQMGLIPDQNNDVEGYLDAKTVFKRWAEDFGFFVKGMNIDD